MPHLWSLVVGVRRGSLDTVSTIRGRSCPSLGLSEGRGARPDSLVDVHTRLGRNQSGRKLRGRKPHETRGPSEVEAATIGGSRRTTIPR